MEEERKNAVLLSLDILRKTLNREGISLGFNKDNNSLFFFDTEKYVTEKKFDGFSVSLNELVK